MNKNRLRLLKTLLENRNRFISGEAISRTLSISRTAVWKHIEELKKEGYDIQSVRKQGYRLLHEPDTLSESTLLPYLQTKWLGQAIHVYDEVESTQHIAHRLAAERAPSGTVVIADKQLGGKGRLGRPWDSPSGTGVWMSFILRPALPLAKINLLTLLSAVAILRGIQQVTDVELHIKWPNDILSKGRKVAGILTELNAEADRVNEVVLGMGLNVNQKRVDFPETIRSVATSLREEQGEPVSRRDCIVSILGEWERLYELYVQHGFEPIKTLWETYAVSLGENIVARTGQGTWEGVAKGITNEGVLLLEKSDGTVQPIYSADIHIPS